MFGFKAKTSIPTHIKCIDYQDKDHCDWYVNFSTSKFLESYTIQQGKKYHHGCVIHLQFTSCNIHTNYLRITINQLVELDMYSKMAYMI